jgi:cytochrome c-type biogenesis protein CcmE
MKKKFLLILLTVVLVAVLLVVQATRTGAASVLLAGDLAKRSSDLSRIRVAGRVSSDPIDYQVEPNFVLRFQIEDRPLVNGKESDQASASAPSAQLKIPVVFEGVKPDMFSSGRDVIIDGDFRGGILYASNLLTQCPSKYEPPKPGEESRSSEYSPASQASS